MHGATIKISHTQLKQCSNVRNIYENVSKLVYFISFSRCLSISTRRMQCSYISVEQKLLISDFRP